MIKDVWSTVVNTATAVRAKVRKPVRLWVIRPIVVFVGSIATGVYVTIWSAVEFWNSSQWSDE